MAKDKSGKRRAYVKIKRVLDVFFSCCLLAFLWLPMLLIALAVRLDTSGKAIFRQERVGRGGRIFICYKFRTMYSHTPKARPSASFPDVERYVTPVGRILRRTSLDELPQLFNVIKGDMSIVGPRPLILEEREVHEGRAKRGVYDLRPGITGLSQVNGRDGVSDAQKIALDAEYASSLCLLSDLKIVFKTLFKVIKGEGIATCQSEKNIDRS